jgi:hypothetical protein
MVAAFFVWTVLVLSWPRISPMIATILYPVKSQQVHNSEKLMVRQNIEQELDRARRELFDKIVTRGYGLGLERLKDGTSPEVGRAKAAFGSARQGLEKQFQERLVGELDQLDQEYANRRRAQSAIARNLSRLTPVSSYTYVVTEVSGTGVLELDTFLENSRRFQREVKAQLYDKTIHEWYGSTTARATWRKDYNVPGFDPAKEPVPQMRYLPAPLSKALKWEWVDILLLCLYNIVFFAAGYAAFLKYDVR